MRQHLVEYPDDVVIVAIDERSLESLGGWPWDRHIHARLLEKLQFADAIAFDIIFSEPLSAVYRAAGESSSSAGSDAQFASAIKAHGDVLLPMYIEQQQYSEFVREILPIPELAESAAAIGHVNLAFDNDGIVRGLYQRAGLGRPYWEHLSAALVTNRGEDQSAGDRVDSQIPDSPYSLSQSGFQLIRFIGAAESVFYFSYKDVLDGEIPATQFTGKKVFVGATAQGLGDNIATPLGVMPGVELHVNAYQALRNNAVMTVLDSRAYLSVVVIAVLSVCLLLSRLSPTLFLFGSLVAGVLSPAAVALIFFYQSIWIAPSPFVFSLFCFYPLWSWRRILIALSYLREELAELKSQAGSDALTLSSLRRDGLALQEAGLLEEFELVLLPGALPADVDVWPSVSHESESVSTTFELDNRACHLSLKSAGSAMKAEQVLTALLSSQPLQAHSPRDSYELVERTIDEISTAKAAANRLQQQMNQSMMHLQDAVLVADSAGRLLFYNESASGLFGDLLTLDSSIVDLQEPLGKLIWAALLRRVMLDGEVVYQEMDSLQQDKLLCQAAPVAAEREGATLYVFVFTDVTRLRELERSKNEALAFLSHDMRSPIVSQLALIQSASHAEPELDRNHSTLLPRLAAFAEKSLKYAEDFLQLARAENLDEEQFQLVDMHGVIDSAHANTVNQAALKGIVIKSLRTEQDCWVLGDAQLLERAVTNLLQNAIQHSGQSKEVGLNLRLEGLVFVEVVDHGAGIDENLLPNLFEPYFRARNGERSSDQQMARADELNKKSSKARNYGLGLSFVHSVVMSHGGKVDVESELGKGTKFSLAFPMTTVE